MKRFLALLCFASVALAQPTTQPTNTPVQKATATNNLTAGFDIGSGTTVNVEAGGTIANAGTINGAGTFNFGSGTVTLPATVSGGASSFQALDATLTALAAYNTNGILTQTAADTFVGRTITGTTNQITVTNGDGVAGNPTLSLPTSLASINAITSASGQNLVLTGNGGASLTISQGANGAATVTPLGSGRFNVTSAVASNGYTAQFSRNGSTLGLYNTSTYVGVGSVTNHPLDFFTFDGATQARLTTTGNLLVGTTTDASSLSGGLALNGSGAGSTATSTSTGTLRVTGGGSFTGQVWVTAGTDAGIHLHNSASGNQLARLTRDSGNDAGYLTLLSAGSATLVLRANGNQTLPNNVAVGGDLTVSGGNVGVGGVSSDSAALYLRGNALTGVGQIGVQSETTFSSAATTYGAAGYFATNTSAATFTMANGRGLWVGAPTLGATSAITTQTGLLVSNQGATGITHAYGIDIAAQSGAATTNIGLRNAGTTLLNGAVTIGADVGFSGGTRYVGALGNGAGAGNSFTVKAGFATTAIAGDLRLAAGRGNSGGTNGNIVFGISDSVDASAALTSTLATINGASGLTTLNGNLTVGTGAASTVVAQATGLTDVSVKAVSSAADSYAFMSVQNDARQWTMRVNGADSDKFNIRDSTAGADRLNIDSSGMVSVVASITGTSTTAAALLASSLGITGASSVGGVGAFGGNVTATIGLGVRGSSITSGVNQWALYVDQAVSSAATSGAWGAQIQVSTAAASFTVANAYGLNIGSPVVGAGSAITNLYGLKIENQASGGTLNYALYTGTGLVRFGDHVTIASTKTLQLGNAAVAETPSATHTLTLKDSTGTSYRVLAVAVP
jgi:fibronectin-binding autotransporter adhesin